jgi:hypothetical protein
MRTVRTTSSQPQTAWDERDVAEWMMDDVVAAQRLDAAALQLSQVDADGAGENYLGEMRIQRDT